MTDEAIREDVSSEVEKTSGDSNESRAAEVKEEKPSNPRLAALENIAKSVRKDEQIEEADEEEAEESEVTQEPESPVFFKDGVWMTRAKVNGEEIEVPVDEIKSRYQKDTAAEKRLEQAAERMRQLEQREAQLREYEQRLSQQQPSSDAARSAPSGNDAQNNAVKKAIEAIYSGDEDAANEALQMAIASGRNQPQKVATPEELTAEIERRIEAREAERSRLQAVDKFRKEFPEIAGDPDLWEVADRHTLKVAQENPNMSIGDVIIEAGKRTRAWFGKMQPSQKQERKRETAGQAVNGVNARASLGEDEPRPMTPSEIIAQMRERRVS
jgi:hypothetical protein